MEGDLPKNTCSVHALPCDFLSSLLSLSLIHENDDGQFFFFCDETKHLFF